jgi:hypothetical protein
MEKIVVQMCYVHLHLLKSTATLRTIRSEGSRYDSNRVVEVTPQERPEERINIKIDYFNVGVMELLQFSCK